ncbi:MAG: ribbon-helix-helix protein, CopG family [Acidobacteria bacterium]|nr:ribbon-helix-helix protein, CopG family [Acidobacteriota bacterium]
MIKRRTKMVSIRLLDDEYRRLKELCEAKGARSVSDLARDAMFRMLSPSTPDADPNALEHRVRTLDQKVARLGEQMEEISSRLERGRGAATWAG